MTNHPVDNGPDCGISVIVPALNAAGSIADCLNGIFHQTVSREEYEVIVVDDGSSDQTARIAMELGARVVRIAHAGPAAARNHGIAMARGEILLFTDADCVPTRTWIESMVAPLRDGADGAKGTYLSNQPGLVPRFVQAEFEERYRLLAKFDQIDFVDTYSAAYRRAALDRFGMFDPRFLLAEDAELSFRLTTLGCRLVFAPSAQVYHRHPESVASYLRRKYRYGVFRTQAYALTPSKVGRDSYTPKTMVFEVAIAGLLLTDLLLSPINRPARRFAIVLLIGHFALSLPFALSAAQRDMRVGLVAPGLIFGRSCAQAFGCLVGTLRLIYLGTGLFRGRVR